MRSSDIVRLLAAALVVAASAGVGCSSDSGDGGDEKEGVEEGDASAGGGGSRGGASNSGGSPSAGGAPAVACEADTGDSGCRECLAAKCCAALEACLADATCSAALTAHEECFRVPGADPSECFGEFTRTLGGSPSSPQDVAGCIIVDCSGTVCGAPQVV